MRVTKVNNMNFQQNSYLKHREREEKQHKLSSNEDIVEPRLPKRLSLWKRIMNALRDEKEAQETISQNEDNIK